MDEKYYQVVPSEYCEKVLRKIKKWNPDLSAKLHVQIKKIAREPEFGKPLRHILKNYRRIHIESFVLLYEFRNNEVHLIDFDHHGKIYKKY